MTSNERAREMLRGSEETIFDLCSKTGTTMQWEDFLQAPLECAAGEGDQGLSEKLVNAGAEIGGALFSAIRGGHGEIVDFLLENGASMGAWKGDDTALHVAARVGNPEIVRSLIVMGAEKDARDTYGRTPLRLAARYGHVAVAEVLLAAGADVTPGKNGSSSLLATAAYYENTDVLRALVKHGADVDARYSSGRTCLHEAAASNKVGTINVLAEVGANIDAKDDTDGSPLHAASNGCFVEATLALLQHGAAINAQEDELLTPLHCAAFSAGSEGTAEVVDLLLRWGADETMVDEDGKIAADMIWQGTFKEYELADVERVRELLAKAPADRAWRRRGLLVLCRAYPDRVQLSNESGQPYAGVTPRTTCSRAKLKKAEASSSRGGGVGGSTPHERNDGGWSNVPARVVGLMEEGIFRTIVGYL